MLLLKRNEKIIYNSTSDFVNVQKFANFVYDDANRDPNYKMGNSNFGDGYKFRGRGIFQLTGKYNYQKFTTFYQSKYDSNIDFTTNPDLVATNIEIAVISALWFYENNVNSDSITSDTSVNEVTKKINGGKKGLKHRKSLFNKTKIHINCK
ncbi:MAG: glycoside hydrolase family 19 protein [Polaribacter sp.]|nr:glycoside hydrolase family 19 protein [Polaribacter sp.]MDG1810867.1 glycoside hydrolase family 19 protein [Polaribacter sp.]MDG1993144.1 glycoside hydrolase family 19 protein [Polaribacter sp.]